MTVKKKLPNYFNKKDEIPVAQNLALTFTFHGLLILVLALAGALQALIFPLLPKPELPVKDVEFRLVQNESKPPINKKTNIRSDKDSRAGGIHDPKKIISEPSPKSAAAPAKKAPAPKPQPTAQQKPQKQVQKPVQKPIQQQPKPTVAQNPVAKPTPAKAPSLTKPNIKPTPKPPGVNTPSAPKIATAPKSPFTMAAPAAKAPVGTTYKPAGSPSSSGGGSKGTTGAAPAPKFSSSGGSGGSTGRPSNGSSGSYAARGSGGRGTGNNPGPGNPSGAPGIDAIRQPNWGPYMKDLEQRIKRNWYPPKGDSSKRIVVTFVIGRDGRLLSHKITKSSGTPTADRAAVSAIELTAPFRPLPPEYKGQSIPIEFTFDYNVINSSVLR